MSRRAAMVAVAAGHAAMQTWVGVQSGWAGTTIAIVVVSWLAVPAVGLKPRQ